MEQVLGIISKIRYERQTLQYVSEYYKIDEHQLKIKMVLINLDVR